MTCCEISCTALTGVMCSALYVTFAVYLGIFAFNNPDKQAYYYDTNNESKMTEDTTGPNKNGEDVH